MTSVALPLHGRIALVTGASRGIGAAVSELLARNGAHVVLMARSVPELELVHDKIVSAGGAATIMPFDVSKIDELEALGPTLLARFGRLDIWVANAGIMRDLTPVSHSKIKDWRDTYTLNVLSNVQMIRTLEPLLKASDAGRAVFTASHLGVTPMPFFGAYAVSKAAVIMLAQTWAVETRQTNLRVNIVNPGAVDTAMLRQAFPGGYQGADLHQPEDIAPLYLGLSLPSCTRHGDIVEPD